MHVSPRGYFHVNESCHGLQLVSGVQFRNVMRKSKSNPNFRGKYKQLRNQVTSQIRRQKRAVIQSLSAKNAKEFWKTIKLLNGKASTTIPVLAQDGQKVTCEKEKANVLNHYFHSCFNTALPSLTPEDEAFPEFDVATCPQNSFALKKRSMSYWPN